MCSDQQIWIHYNTMATLKKFVRIHEFQDIYMHVYLRFKSCIVVAFLRDRNICHLLIILKICVLW
jgi:hypothetical protein